MPQGGVANATIQPPPMGWSKCFELISGNRNFYERNLRKDRICVYMYVFFKNLCLHEKDTCGDMHNNRSLFFEVTRRVGQKLLAPSLCLERHPRELE